MRLVVVEVNLADGRLVLAVEDAHLLRVRVRARVRARARARVS